MPSLHNEEIRAIQHTLVVLNKRLALAPTSTARMKVKNDIKELERILQVKLSETSDFADIRIEEDTY